MLVIWGQLRQATLFQRILIKFKNCCNFTFFFSILLCCKTMVLQFNSKPVRADSDMYINYIFNMISTLG